MSMYEIYPSYDGIWGREKQRDTDAGLRFAPKGFDWTPIEVEWYLPMVKQLDLAPLEGTLTVSPRCDEGIAAILTRSGDLLKLAGEGAGWVAFRPHEHAVWVDEDASLREQLPPALAQSRSERYESRGLETPPNRIVKYAMLHDRLMPNTVALVKSVPGLVAVEDESSEPDFADPAKCGFRAWVKHHGVTGVVFKKIWDSTNTVHYDPNWGLEMPRDAHDEWD